jgi:hypothetical protein
VHRLLRACLLTATVAAATSLSGSSVHAQDASNVSRAGLESVRAGVTVRVWTDAIWRLRIASDRPDYYEGTIARRTDDMLVFKMKEPIATIAGVGLGRVETESLVPLAQVRRLQLRTRQLSPSRLLTGALLGAAAGTAVALSLNDCGWSPGAHCSGGRRAAVGALTFAIVGGGYGLRPETRWREVEVIPGRR